MSLSTANTPQVLQSSLDQAFSQQLQTYRLLNEVMKLPELSRRQRVPGHNVQIVDEPTVDTVAENGLVNSSDITFAQVPIAYQKFGVRSVTSNELVMDWLNGVNDAPELFDTMMQTHARGLVAAVNGYILEQYDAAANIADSAANPNYSTLLNAAVSVQGQDEPVSVVCSAGAKAAMAAEQASLGASGWFSGYPVESVIGFPVSTTGNIHSLAGDLSSSGRCSVELRHSLTDQSEGTSLAINDQVQLISFARVWVGISDASRIVKGSYAA